ncbi:HIRAN domain-containing protein [Rosistilla oblonga]|uniref:HIRAN domain-containing protein n=1 Tax=Rosistilla oblonga TaxID=2527990 RepID=UPI003A9846F5
MAANESALAMADVTWFEIATLKRPAGIPLGGDNYLKEIGTGTAYLTTKQVSMIGDLQSKKFVLNSVQRVTRYADGILFNRSSGKSVFLKTPMLSELSARFGLVAEYTCSGEPVLGVSPSSNFIPNIVDAEVIEPMTTHPNRNRNADSDPRYTFRVVGDFVGNRESHIRRLRVGDQIWLVKEPSNVHDPHAVAVFDVTRNQLGYLKRDVASWFSPLLGRKTNIEARVHCFTSEGALIVGVYC